MQNGKMSDLTYTDVAWRRASACNELGACVELRRRADGSVAIRNSRYPDGTVLTYDREAIRDLVAGVKDGEFDDLAA